MSAFLVRFFSKSVAVVIPIGMAAAVAFSDPVACAAPAASARLAVGASPLSLVRPHAVALPARHRQARHREVRRLRAYRWAARQAGQPYAWGGVGPSFDCSGLVMMAYQHTGINLPRTTDAMLASPLLVRVVHPRMGDLAFYGVGHVELFRRWGYTFGAHDSGSLVGLIRYGWGWKPTAFYRVR